jgi:hypothetical protein
MVGDRIEPPTFRYSGVADVQLRPDVREYLAVYGCDKALMTAVVAVAVASEIPADLPLPRRGSQAACATRESSLTFINQKPDHF